MDETWANAHHTVASKWYDGSSAGKDVVQAESPLGKGKGFIVLHAGSEKGSLPECSLIFVSRTNSADYHDEKNGDHFEEWIEHKLLPSLPAGAAIIMDNAPSHSIKTKELWAPTLSTWKAEMQA